MDDLISRRAAIDAMINSKSNLDITFVPGAYANGYLAGRKNMLDELLRVVYDLQSVTPEPRTGKWVERECGTEDKEAGWKTIIVCSNCDFPATTFYSENCKYRTQIRTDYCPSCGAKMCGGEQK